MSAIGDYVHLTRRGYEENGILEEDNKNKKEKDNNKENKGKGWVSPREKIKTRLEQNKVKNSKSLEEIENAITAIQKSQEKEFSEIRNQIENKIKETFVDKINTINIENMTVDVIGSKGPKVGTISGVRKDGHISFDYKKVTDRINTLEDILTDTIENSNLTLEDIDKAKEYLKKIKTLYKEIYNKTAAQVKSWGYPAWVEENANLNSKKISELRSIANEAIEKFAKYPAISLYEGTLWEQTLAAASYCAKGTAMKSVKESFIGVKGDQNIKIDFNMDNFVDNFKIKQEIGDKVNINIDGTINRRSKIDVEFEWGEDNPIKISAKNVAIRKDLYHWVSVVSGSPLLVMIAGMDADFVNHYLNIYSKHTDGIIEDKDKIVDEMKLALFYSALTGDNYTSQADSANVFAFNDKVSGTFKLLPMGFIIKKLENNARAISVQLNGVSITNHHFKNAFADTIDQRLSNLIMELHQAKVHIGFNLQEVIRK